VTAPIDDIVCQGSVLGCSSDASARPVGRVLPARPMRAAARRPLNRSL
jgi:hypothetical protein